MSNSGMIMDDPFSATQEKMAALDVTVHQASIALVKDEDPIGSFVLLTPKAVHTLVEHKIHVFMQHGFGGKSNFSDMDYASAGVDFIDTFAELSGMSNVIVKFTPFTSQQITEMKTGQVALSTLIPTLTTAEQIMTFNAKNATALAMNYIKDSCGMFKTDRILSEMWSADEVSVAMSNFFLPLLETLATNDRIKFVLQKDPSLMQSAYCFNGTLCNKELAEQLNLPWKDIISLCWEMN